MNVAGIDYSTRAVDIVLIPANGGHPSWHPFELEGNDAFDRTRNVAEVLPGRGHSFWDNIVAVGIEHPGGKFGTRDMTRVQGAILSCIPARALVEPWPPAKWRKRNGMAGNASKQDVSEVVHTAWPDLAGKWPQDACDAYFIALATLQAMR